jgi:hypothetical protein
MLVGIVIMLPASAAFNGAPIVLRRLATRTLPDHTGAALLHAVLTRCAGLAGRVLSPLGWAHFAVPFCGRHIEPGEYRARTTLYEPEGRACEPCSRKYDRP